jgi:hypothetical protein
LYMRLPCCLYITPIISRQQSICVFVSPPNSFVFYAVCDVQRKAGNQFVPELLVLTFVIHTVVFWVTIPCSLVGVLTRPQYEPSLLWNPQIPDLFILLYINGNIWDQTCNWYFLKVFW